MTNIEQKALELVNEVTAERNGIVPNYFDVMSALCRAIERHDAFRQEVSDAAEEIAKAWGTADPAWGYLRRFIITKPDPLVEAMIECGFGDSSNAADDIRAALAKRGLEIREKSDG